MQIVENTSGQTTFSLVFGLDDFIRLQYGPTYSNTSLIALGNVGGMVTKCYWQYSI